MLIKLEGWVVKHSRTGEIGTVLKVGKEAYDDMGRSIPKNERVVTAKVQFDDRVEDVIVSFLKPLRKE